VRSTPHKVLVVDDDPFHLEIYGLLLEQAGYEPVSALVRLTGPDFPADPMSMSSSWIPASTRWKVRRILPARFVADIPMRPSFFFPMCSGSRRTSPRMSLICPAWRARRTAGKDLGAGWTIVLSNHRKLRAPAGFMRCDSI